MKKGQTSEFMGIIMLVIVLVLILIFTRMTRDSSRGENLEKSVRDLRNIFVSTSVTKFPMITEKGVSLNELFGVLVCYFDFPGEMSHDETQGVPTDPNYVVDYGSAVGEIDIDAVIADRLDKLYSSGIWKLQINIDDDRSMCITSNSYNEIECPPFGGKEYVNFNFMFPVSCSVGMAGGKIFIITQ